MTAVASLHFKSSRSDAGHEPLADRTLRPPLTVEARPGGGSPTLTALRACTWFAAWPAPALVQLAAVSSLRSFAAGQTIAAEGTSPEAVALVVKGRVRSVRRAEAGREVTLEVFRAGELCSERLFEEGGVLGHDWIAGETSLLLFIPRSDFLAHVRSNPEAVFALAANLERRLETTKKLAAGLVLADAESRLLDVLARLARDEGEVCPEGTLVRRSPTQQELGNMIGACRETVSRMVAELARQERLSVRGRKMTLAPGFVADLERRALG